MTHTAIARIAAAAAHRNPGKTISMALIENVDPALLDAYVNGQRVRVTTTYPYPGCEQWTRTGRVSVSLGWTPTLLLVHRSNQRGSSDTLGAHDVVVAVQSGAQYFDLDAPSGPYSVETPYGRDLKRRRSAVGITTPATKVSAR